ncbi:citramalyl-CoA lyase, mitochondrial-like [Onthophagus taurus]|uniref:citramalyl-CoA lyase, mitochondrial-like n=1 Tax=Onthophagus taurus TaxID=166361 RepID=UPI000C2020AB|nr:citrate lyase subunit beta-like protein, mitochondrial [Onthophagus taurus]
MTLRSLTRFSVPLFNRFLLHNKTSVRCYKPRRALMYVPGDDTRKLSKAFKVDVDCIVMDCEDGVAMSRKETARNTIRKLLDNGKPLKPRDYDWAIRVNSVHSGLLEEDLRQVLTAEFLPDTILLPKITTVDHLKYFSDQVNNSIKDEEQINLVMYIEDALAMINLVDLCKSAFELSKTSKFKLTSLIFGSDDFCASIGISRSENASEILYARQKLVVVAKAYGLQAIDMVYIQYKDLEGLKRQSDEGARMGYTGKQVIHPNQVPIVQEAFLPSQKQIEWASAILNAFEEQQKIGKGAFNLEGTMIDMPTVKQAQNIMNLMRSV